MSQQQFFGLLIECPLDRDTYEAKLIAQGAVEAAGRMG
jgi:hypothetical protein